MTSLVLALLASLTVISPPDGSVVPTLKVGQKSYFSGVRSERFLRMNNVADRAKLLSIGSTQQPVKLSWLDSQSSSNVAYTILVEHAEGGSQQRFSVTNLTTVYLTNLELGRKYAWKVYNKTHGLAQGAFTTEAIPPRFLRAEGVGNFRDLGGWRTIDGRKVKENLIFRSAGLRSSSKSSGGFFKRKVTLGSQRVTECGLSTLNGEFKIRTDLELRTPQETAGMEASLLGDKVNWCKISFAAYDFIDNSIRGREPLVKIFRLFTQRDNYPILMHCSGGRDRTGTLAFILNGLLGVPEDDLCKDWEASIFSDPGMGFGPDRIERLLAYLKKYPGDTVNDRIEAYVRSCGVTPEEIAAFRAIML